MLLCAGSDRADVQELQDHLECKLRNVAQLRNITRTLAEDRDVS